MCGIVGIVWADPNRASGADALSRALRSIEHRGPDGEGTLIRGGICAGMRRLAIVDLVGGDQPIFNETGDVGVLFNGEIYNQKALRAELEARGHRFKTRADTEVLVHGYEEYGDALLDKLDGMFAFVVWDDAKKRALLARDRFGVKPLYVARTALGLAFASETKALAAAGWIDARIDPAPLGAYFRFSWVPEPKTMWRGVERLEAAHAISVERGAAGAAKRYFRAKIGGAPKREARDIDEEIRALTAAAVERQTMSDVPVGLFLSGGLDSSLIAAVAKQRGLDLPCHCIEVTSRDNAGDPYESDVTHARVVAQTFGLNLTVHRLEARVVDLLPKLMRSMDDPAGDPAILNAYLIADAARPTTKVLLSGMGADELAGGYRRAIAARALTPLYRAPRALRAVATTSLRALAPRNVSSISKRPLLRRWKKAASSAPEDVRDLPEAFSSWIDDELIASLGLARPESLWPFIEEAVERADARDPLEACLAFDFAQYLPSHNLLYFDKATMAASVEARVPFLDNALAAAIMALPPSEKVRGATTKRALRRACEGLLPESILRRKKTGFGAPIRAWLRGELAPMVGDLLSPRAVKSRGLLDPIGVEKILDLHRRDVVDLSYTVWGLLSLEVWCREVMDKGAR